MIQIRCQNERFTYDMYHIVKSFFPDAEITQTVEPEQESLIMVSIGSDSCFAVRNQNSYLLFYRVKLQGSKIKERRKDI